MTGSPPDAPTTRCPIGRAEPAGALRRDGLALARMVGAQVRVAGKHALPDGTLAGLAGLRTEFAPDPFLDAFLDCLLDRLDGRVHNRTYLALPLIEQLLADPAAGLDADGMAALLIADVVRHEVRAAGYPREDRPKARTLRTRLRHARRFVDQCTADRTGAEPDAIRADVLEDLPVLPDGPLRAWFALSVQPMGRGHDEYMFIRVLQAHEMVFARLAGELDAVRAAVRGGDAEAALAGLGRVDTVIGRAGLLFRLVATMRPETFHAFRVHTQGASAIQSEQYKRFEAACGAPRADRLASPAFGEVPRVWASVLDGQDDLSQAWLDVRGTGAFTAEQEAAVDTGLASVESAHQRWKAAHRGLASRVLGEARGTGDTAGVAYLDGCLANRLFWQVPTVAA